MKRKEELYQPKISEEIISNRQSFINSVEQLNVPMLDSVNFEDVSEALHDLESLQSFRKGVNKLPFGSFHEAVEEITLLEKLPIKKEEKTTRFKTLVETLERKAVYFSPRVADLYLGMFAEIKGEAYQPKFNITQEKLSELKKSGDLDSFFNGNISWEIKLNRIETRLTDYLLGVRALDKREGEEMNDDLRVWRENELKKASIYPPERKNEFKPGVDPMERLKEKESAPAIWSIYPALSGYYREQSFSRWDNKRNVWVEDEYAYKDAKIFPLSNNADYKKGPIDITLTAQIFANKWVTLPIPYTHSLHKIETDNRKHKIQQDQNGDVFILVEGDGEIKVKALLAPHQDKKFRTDPSKVRVPEISSEFTEETNQKLEEIAREKRGNISKAWAISSYVRNRIKYLAPKDRAESEYYNSAYNSHPKGFAGAVDELKTADCDVANSYFAALCAKLNIPVRHVIGYSVKDKNKEGFASIHAGNGHAWSEVWDEIKKEWIIIDATSPGDPNLEKDEKKNNNEFVPGDYGKEEAIRPSDEELEALRKKLAERKEKLSYTKEERSLAEYTSIELKEARQIVKEINEAENMRLPNGERIVDVLTKLFNAIIESRKSVASVYTGPVRKSEGGERIKDIVRHKIGILAGETDPLSREKPDEEVKEEKNIGGFDLYMIGDKSASMQFFVKNESLWQMQRRATYLILSSLHRFEKNIERASLLKENALSVRTQSISFRGNNIEDIDLDKPLSSSFSLQDKVRLWHSLTEKGHNNGDVKALSVVYEQIKKEIEEQEKHGAKDNRLRLVIACSDGGYLRTEGQMRALAEELGKLKVVVVGMGLTETAENVPVVMDNPPWSRGDIARNINDLPMIVAKHVLLEAIKLFPEKAKENAKQVIESSLAKLVKQ